VRGERRGEGRGGRRSAEPNRRGKRLRKWEGGGRGLRRKRDLAPVTDLWEAGGGGSVGRGRRRWE
jgi:hypothetical protein